MELCIALVGQIFCLFLMGACGGVLARLGVVRREECQILSSLGVYLFSPCLVFTGFLSNITGNEAGKLAVAFGLSAAIHLLFIALVRLYRRVRRISGVDAASMLISNAGNIVIPLVIGTVGKEYVVYATPYLIVQNLFTWTYGVKLVSERDRYDLRQIVTNPTLIAISIGFILMALGLRVPQALASVIESLGNCMPPISMVLVGITVAELEPEALRGLRDMWEPVAGRLVFFPAIALGLVVVINQVLDLSSIWKVVFVVMLGAAGPSAALVPQIAEIYRKNTERAAYINVASTLCCIVTLPVMAFLLQAVL